jgi:hypothetical protein
MEEMKLIKLEVIKNTNLQELLSQKKKNDFIILYEGEFDTWLANSKGVVIQKGNKILLNGEKLLYEGEFDTWTCEIDESVITIKKKNQWLNNGTVLCSYTNEPIHPHQSGNFAFGMGEKISLPVYVEKFNQWFKHPEGKIIIRKNQILLC